MVKIYVLIDPTTNQIRYVGRTIKPIKLRRWEHISCKKNSLKKAWIISLRKKGVSPIIEEIDSIEENGNWQLLEQYWICQLRAWGFKLTNMTEGGDCGVMTEKCLKAGREARKKLPPPMLGKKHSEETKERIRNKLLGNKFSLESRKKMSDASKGKPKTNQHRKNISKGKKSKTLVL